jgi:hypothetical protein
MRKVFYPACTYLSSAWPSWFPGHTRRYFERMTDPWPREIPTMTITVQAGPRRRTAKRSTVSEGSGWMGQNPSSAPSWAVGSVGSMNGIRSVRHSGGMTLRWPRPRWRVCKVLHAKCRSTNHYIILHAGWSLFFTAQSDCGVGKHNQKCCSL